MAGVWPVEIEQRLAIEVSSNRQVAASEPACLRLKVVSAMEIGGFALFLLHQFLVGGCGVRASWHFEESQVEAHLNATVKRYYVITLRMNVRVPNTNMVTTEIPSNGKIQPIPRVGKLCPLIGGTIEYRRPSAAYVSGLNNVNT